MTSKERVLERERQRGRAAALELQGKADGMSGAQLYEAADNVPSFAAACARQNMLERTAGFVCRSSAGRMVRLLQPYDSAVYPQEPEELPAQWGFAWSDDSAHALPFVAFSTSPYMMGHCCTEGDATYRSTVDNNVWAPSAYPSGWEVVE